MALKRKGLNSKNKILIEIFFALSLSNQGGSHIVYIARYKQWMKNAQISI